MTRNDIATGLCTRTGISKSSALHVVDEVINILADSFVGGDNLYLRGFGTFEIKATKEKKARNINAGTMVVIPAGRTVKFRPCKELKNRMNNGSVD